MPRLPNSSNAPGEQQARTAHHFEEYEAGLDRVGPQYASEEEANQEAMVRAAGVSAYTQFGEEC